MREYGSKKTGFGKLMGNFWGSVMIFCHNNRKFIVRIMLLVVFFAVVFVAVVFINNWSGMMQWLETPIADMTMGELVINIIIVMFIVMFIIKFVIGVICLLFYLMLRNIPRFFIK